MAKKTSKKSNTTEREQSSDNSPVQEELSSGSSIADRNRVKKEVYAVEDLIDNQEYDRALQSLSETQAFAEAKGINIEEIIDAKKRVRDLKRLDDSKLKEVHNISKNNALISNQNSVTNEPLEKEIPSVILEKYQIFNKIFEHDDIISLSWHPTQNFLAISNSGTGYIESNSFRMTNPKEVCKILNVDSGTVMHSFRDCPAGSLGWCNVGERLISAGSNTDWIRYDHIYQNMRGTIYDGKEGWNVLLRRDTTKYSIIIWDTQNFNIIKSIPFKTAISSLAIKPNDTIMALGEGGDQFEVYSKHDNPKSIQFLNMNTNAIIKTFKGHFGSISFLSWSPDGNSLASGSLNGDVFVWDYQKGTIIKKFQFKESTSQILEWSPDGNYLFISDTLYQVNDWSIQTEINIHILEMAWSKDSTTIAYITFDDQKIILLDVSSGENICEYEETVLDDDKDVDDDNDEDDDPWLMYGPIAWNAKGDLLAVARFIHTTSIMVFRIVPQKNVAPRRYIQYPNKIIPMQTLNPSYAVQTHLIRNLTGHEKDLHCCAWSPDGKSILTGSSDNTLKVWDAASGRELRTLTGHTKQVSQCEWSPDGKRFLSGSLDTTVKLWDTSTLKVIRTFTGHKWFISCCVWSPDGTKIISGATDRTIIWDAATGREIYTLTGHKDLIHCCAWSPDGTTIVTGSTVKILKLWDVDTGREKWAWSGHDGFVYCCAWSPDGTTILSGSSDRKLKLWDVASGSEIRTLKGHKDEILCCAWSPDGKMVLSGSKDSTLKLWDVNTGCELGTLTGHNGPINCCAWSPDGNMVLSGSVDKTLKMWAITTNYEKE